MSTVYKIHPAIGIARVGNSPTEFFIGPEREYEYPEPSGGFKDAQCRVKRQAARFRIFAHHDDDSFEEITDADAEIVWTVHLANRKAAYPGRGNSEPASDLIIDPGARTTTGPNQQKLFDNGRIRFSGQPWTTVPLGEIRTDTENRLLVLGGFGMSASPAGNGFDDFWASDGWYDDIADGSVSATIKLRSNNATPPVESAWVIVAPPKFAPQQENVTTLYDRVLQAMVDANLAIAPTATSYTRDVYPILQSARDIKWVYQTFAHGGWTDPVTSQALRNAIFARLRPSDDMPELAGGDSALTPIQYAHMQRWKDGNFDNDWTGVPTPSTTVTPHGMDRAALDACVGGAFYPGIEAGGRDDANRPILAAANYASAFRIDHAIVPPGTISASMALPWQADFAACGSNWWPVPRPNRVIPQGSNAYSEWFQGDYGDMVANWHKLGFVVQQGDRKVEVERCQAASIVLMTPSLDFVDVPQGPMGMVREQPLAIAFEVISPGTAITLEYAPGGAPSHPQLVPHNMSITVGPTAGNAIATARLWVIYRTGAVDASIPTQVVTVREPVSGQTWEIMIDGNTIARRTTSVALVLDRSGSMSEDRGDGMSKHIALQQAAETFVDAMLEGDGVGLVRYDDNAQVVQQVKKLGAGGLSDLNRSNTIDMIRGNSFDPAGATSIGDGIYEGRGILNGAPDPYDGKALVVLTDGKENRARYIADVAAEIDALTYAIGLGTPQNTSAAALQTISGNNGGYLLVTGAIDTHNRFLLQKYFLQILAGVSNADVVLDPDGELQEGAAHRIPFQLTEGDSGIDVIVLSPHAGAIDFRLQTPNGLILEPWRALAEPSMRFVQGKGMAYYRLALPAQLVEGRYDHGGVWHALLTIGKPRMEPTRDSLHGNDRSLLRGLHASIAQRQHRRLIAERPLRNELRRQFGLAQASDALTQWDAADRDKAAAAGSHKRRSLPYSLLVHSYSNHTLRAELHQSGYEPGAAVTATAMLTQSGIPMENGSVWAELTRPDGSRTELRFGGEEPGRFSARYVADIPGVHRLRIRASALSRLGIPFTRERTLTAAVWRGGDHDAQTPPSGGSGGRGDCSGQGSSTDLCGLLRCLLNRDGALTSELERRLEAMGIDLKQVRKCLEESCRDAVGAKSQGGWRDG
jgi:hypothetical protein